MRRLLASSLVVAVAAALVAACGSDEPEAGANGGSEATGSAEAGAASSTSAGASEPGTASGPSGEFDAGSTFSGVQQTGIATYYDYSGSSQVACSFDITSDTNITAINNIEYAGSASCGSCVEVAGPKGMVTVRIVDRCPGCEKNHLDLSEEAFAKIATPSAGRVPITYKVVACAVTGNLSYRFKEGSSEYWTAIQIRNHRLPIAKVEYKKNGVFKLMTRSTYNYFVDTAAAFFN